MGLTNSSVGKNAAEKSFYIKKQAENERIIALAGNPNVGKSTVFNNLTGMNQHTGNWAGKTVTSALGRFEGNRYSYIAIDLPGTYSLFPRSREEEVARDYICFEKPDAVVVVVDACALERNLTLVLQTLEITPRVLVCVNLLDEAEKRGVTVDLGKLSEILGVPVVGTVGRNKKSAANVSDALDDFFKSGHSAYTYRAPYPIEYESAVAVVEEEIIALTKNEENARFLAMLLLEGDDAALKKLFPEPSESLFAALTRAREMICGKGDIFEMRTVTLGKCAGEIAAGVTNGSADRRLDTRLDRIFTGRLTAYPVMLAFFALIFWITITGANYPSKLLSSLLFSLEKPLRAAADFISLPPRVSGLIIDGAYRTLAWVVSVMLPPMAIFFPLFTLLEDAGYLPRIAYNLDRPFKKCNACGKQALTMCMGFGCNAAGVVGSRIIDSKKERLLAILTNNFVPCNGRFPTLIALISMFFVFGVSGFTGGLLSALSLTSVILLSVAVTLLVTKLISVTLLRGESSDFVFELPPYRPVQLARVIVRSVFDRTLHVLARSAAVAAPAGALIWILANTNIGGESLLAHGAAFLDPLGRLMGLDGVILLGFILGLPANEIVLPIILMIYTCGTSVSEITSTLAMREVLAASGFTRASAVCMIIFTLMHFPCSTTLITIKKETGSIKWTLLAALIPTVVGMILCMLFNAVIRIIL